MTESLPKGEIFFLQDAQSNDLTFMKSLYVRGDMTKRLEDTETPDGVLGIRLLEMCLGEPLEATKYRQRHPIGDAASDPLFGNKAAKASCIAEKEKIVVPVFSR
ncbi:hypothetical protein AJ79_05334 [Helicocarpus griseus UAMH5409]|uniref:Uncharacterized protein n=1 Tax=Helicocarpus griseus UAMH5409 TaxID=1447875 RepID=A0A2B7XPP5_9EURO|nr:hypothetical protein AJ79_05334 [Helicocarpus griseus UAMH5409]